MTSSINTIRSKKVSITWCSHFQWVQTNFKPVITRISKIKSLSVVFGDKAYDSEDNHVLVREKLHGFSVIPPRYEKDVPVWKTRGKYRKEKK